MLSLSTVLFRIGMVFLIVTLLDLYVFQGLKAALGQLVSQKTKTLIYFIYWAIPVGLFATIVFLLTQFSPTSGPTKSFYWFMGFFILFTVPKLVFGLILLAEDVYRLGEGTITFIISQFQSQRPENYFSQRRQLVSQLGAGLAMIPFGGILYGMWKGKYQYTVHESTITFPDLPAAFDGFKIVQISDVHSGSFDNAARVAEGIDLINAQKADLFVFTGDIVNNLASELEPWVPLFQKIKAPLGQFSILGNHDYSDYIQWPSLEAKKANLDKVKSLHKEIGFRLLLNESIKIEKDGQSIRLLGMENWGKGFSQYGDLEKTLAGVDNAEFKVLLSHDPSHWDEQVLNHTQNIHLALAGHTHGMQFGIEIPGFKWSPVKFRYPRWAGLYEEKGKYLYVNRGFGYLAFPGRVGIWPEITVLTLKRG